MKYYMANEIGLQTGFISTEEYFKSSNCANH
jgi:hypothetical protein